MSENLLFVATPHIQDTSNTLSIHANIKTSQDEYLASGTIPNVNLNKDIISSLTENWYQKDLAHMKSDLMQAETNSTDTALGTTLSPNLMSRSYSFNDNVYGGYYPNNWGSVDLSGLGNYYGTGSWRDRPDVVRAFKADAITDATNIFHSVFNRDPNANELNNAAGSVYGANGETKKLNALQNKLAYSKEGHDRIANIGIGVLGYAPDENWVKQEQAKLAKYGTTQQDIRKDFAYSQAAYDRIHENISRIRGYDFNNPERIRHEQDRLASGESFHDLMANYAYDQETHDRIRENVSRIKGRDWNDEGMIKHEQDRLAGGESFHDLMANYAYDQETYNIIRDNANRVFGYYWGNDNNVRWVQGRLVNGESLKDILNSFAYSNETYNRISQDVGRILGYPWNDPASIHTQQGRLQNEGMQAVLDSFAYSNETYNRISQDVGRILGYPWNDPASIHTQQ
ncbi:unnamed protein product, partial [Commensalibacter communis]